MGNFCEISTDLWPLFHVKILFPHYVVQLLTNSLQILYNSSYLEGVLFYFCQIPSVVLDLRMSKFRSALYLELLLTKIFCAFVLN